MKPIALLLPLLFLAPAQEPIGIFVAEINPAEPHSVTWPPFKIQIKLIKLVPGMKTAGTNPYSGSEVMTNAANTVVAVSLHTIGGGPQATFWGGGTCTCFTMPPVILYNGVGETPWVNTSGMLPGQLVVVEVEQTLSLTTGHARFAGSRSSFVTTP